jgi:hypothetical protein
MKKIGAPCGWVVSMKLQVLPIWSSAFPGKNRLARLLFFMGIICCLIFPLSAQETEAESGQEDIPRFTAEERPPYRSNWLLYLYEENANYSFHRLIPFYSYTTYPNRLRDEFWFWPLLAGYEIGKSTAPTAFPFAADFQWYTFPFLALGSSQLNKTEDIQTTTLVSFLFMTYFQERQMQDKYLARSWYSLPLLSYYHSENLWDKETEVSTIAWGSPLFAWRDTHIVYHRQIYPAYEWTFSPLSLLLGENAISLLHHARWGRDHLWQMLTLDSFSLFSIATTFSQYPGALYTRFLRADSGERALQSLMAVSLTSPRTRMAILSPLFVFESSPSGFFSWQFLPFFRYVAQGLDTHFYLLPLCLDFSSDGIRFTPQPKWFPLIYHDEMYNSWDILWPLFRYTQDVDTSAHRFTMRFIFDSQSWRDARDGSCYDFSLLERLLLSYRQKNDTYDFALLPAGLLFAYYKDEQQYHWSVLGFGYGEAANQSYLQLLFFKISLGG